MIAPSIWWVADVVREGPSTAIIATAAAGEAALDPAVQCHVVAALATDGARSAESAPPSAPQLPDDLTPREAEVLTLIAEGLTNAEIAERLVVSPTAPASRSHLAEPHSLDSRPRGRSG